MRIKYRFISVIFVLFFLNISSSFIVVPKHEHQSLQIAAVPPLRGFIGNIQEIPNEKDITTTTEQNYDDSSSFDCATSFSPITKIQSESTEDAVDNDYSNVDNSADKGSNTNFNDQQVGPDGNYDVFTESNSPQQKEIDLKINYWSGWQDNWTKSGTSPYLDEADDGNYVYGNQSGIGSNHGDLTGEFEFENTSITSTINSVKLRVYGSAGTGQPSQYYFDVYLWDGNTWNQEISFKNIGSLTWREHDVTSNLNTWNKINEAKIYLEVKDLKGNRFGGQVCDAALLRISYQVDNYVIDLEEQWTSANYTKDSEELAIYTGILGSEDLRVDVWTGASWATVINPLVANQWNNASVSSYLTDSSFTIRFKGTLESDDSIQDTYNIDVVFLHTWMSNLPPSVFNITLSPDPLLSNDTLNLSYNYTDPNGDSESGTETRWYRNGLLEGVYNDSKNIPSSALVKNNVWNVTIRPSDGTLYGDLNWRSITVQNTPPSISDCVVNPVNPITTSELTASYTFIDYDGDDENITFREIRWFNNSQMIPTLNDLLTVSADNTKKGEEWYFQIRGQDGANHSSWVTSSSVIINNSIPVASSLTILPAFPRTNNTLTASYSFTDADDDSESNSIIYWYRNGVHNETFDNQINVPSTETKRGESWYFIVQPSDGISYGNIKTSPSVLIQNSAPISGNLTITPSNPYTSDNLTLNYDYFDLDADEQDNNSRQICWYKDGNLQGYLNDSLAVSSSYISKDETWHCKLRVFDGTDFSSWVNLPLNVTIINSAPVVTGIEVTPLVPTSQDSLTLDYSFIDTDLDSEDESLIIWYKNGVLQDVLNGSSTVDPSYTLKNEIWHVKVKPYDGTDYGDWVTLAENVTIGNTPPIASNVEILESSPVDNDSNLHAYYTYFDYDGDEQDNNSRIIFWYWYNGTGFELQPSLNNSMVVGDGNTTIGDIWYFTIRCSDGINLSSEEISPSVTIAATPNTPPEATYLNITPSIATTLSDLYINWTFYDEDLGDEESGTIYYWYINGIHFSSYDSLQTLPALATSKGDEIHVKVKPRDGKDFGSIIGVPVNITIGNTPPSANNLIISPGNPITSNDLHLSYNWSDIDSIDENIGTKIIWYLNGALEDSLNDSDTVPSSLTVKGQIWHCKVQSSDGTDFGDWVSLASNITIGNSVPSVSNLGIIPISPQTNNQLNVSFSFMDPDNDAQLNSYITWYKNGWPVASFTNSTFIPSANTSKGENWYYTIIPSDGEGYGSLRTSPTTTILNSAPTIIDLEIIPFTAQTQDVLRINYTFIDIDKDTESEPEIIWYMNGILQGNRNDSREIASGYTEKGQIWHCKVRPSDGQEFGDWVSLTANITILNTRPTIDSIQIFPIGNVNTNNSLVADFFASDINGDPIIDRIITWFKNGIEISELENSSSVPFSYTQKGENWNYQISVFDGEDWSLIGSPPQAKLILNSKPSIKNVRLTGGFTTLEDIIVVYDFIDPDGDNESVITEFSWTILHNYIPVQNVPNTNLIDSSWFTAGDIIFVEIKPSDGDEFGDRVKSIDYPEGLRVVGNSAPYILGELLIVDQNGTENFHVSTSLNAEYTVIDPDSGESNEIYDIEEDENGLVVGAEYQWYRNGEKLAFLIGPTVNPQHLIAGDTWILSVQPRDRLGDPGPWVNSSAITIGNSRISITDIWFTNLDDGTILTNETFSNIRLSLNWTRFDADGENESDYEIFWYLDNGSGLFVIQPAFENMTDIPTGFIQKGQIWYAIIRITDGTQWSRAVISSTLKIINSPPLISNIVYYFDESLVNITPNARINEFYVVDEHISITYTFSDHDMDPDHTLIQWFKQLLNGSWVEMRDFENQTFIHKNNTGAGEVWYARFIPFDGVVTGLPKNSSMISIISRPLIESYKIQPDISMDVRYNLTAEITDISFHDSIMVKFEIFFSNNSLIMLNGTHLNSNHWNLTIDLLDCINESISIRIYTFTQFNVGGKTFRIFNYFKFNFTAEDKAPPRILEIILEKDNEQNPENLIIFAKLEEYASGITEAILHYSITNSSASLRIGGGSEISDNLSIPMIYLNKSDGIWLYWVTIAYDFGPDILFSCYVSATDGLGNSRMNFSSIDTYNERLVQRFQPELNLPQIFLIVLATLIILISVLLPVRSIQRRRSVKFKRLREFENRLSIISNVYTILVSTEVGVPIYTITNILYQKGETLNDTLSGLSVSIDTFLQSFQSDFMQQVQQDGEFSETENGIIRMSVIEQHQVQVLIAATPTFRIFVFLREKPTRFTKEMFSRAIQNLEKNISIEDLGIVDEKFFGPQVESILNKYFPLTLLKPFVIDTFKLKMFDEGLKRGRVDIPISRAGLNSLKCLVVAHRFPERAAHHPEKLFNEAADKGLLSESRILLYNDAWSILAKLLKIPPNQIYEALWIGCSSDVQIITPKRF